MFGENKKRTTEILREIRSIKSAGEFKFFMNNNQSEFAYSPKVGEYIRDILKNRKQEIKIPELADLIGISKSYLYQIIPVKNNPPKTIKNNPDRKILIAIAVALKFTVDETQHLLKYAKEPELYPRNKFDAAIVYALERGYSIIETKYFA